MQVILYTQFLLRVLPQNLGRVFDVVPEYPKTHPLPNLPLKLSTQSQLEIV